MIEARGVSKRFDDILALNNISLNISEGNVFGLIGTNGAGKSTFLRLASGIFKPETGEVLIDGENVYGNHILKRRFFYISDDQHYLANSTPADMMRFYSRFYEGFDKEIFGKLMRSFDLNPARKIATFSKGMKKQLSIILGLSASTKYLFCDETFDGLDPVMRQTAKSLFAEAMQERGLTPVIASHNLRELEDICDHIGLLHKGGVLLSRDLEDMKLGIHKLQLVPGEGKGEPEGLDIIQSKRTGSIYTLTVRGETEEIESIIRASEPVFYEIIPLSLEEIFISETEVQGYDIKSLII